MHAQIIQVNLTSEDFRPIVPGAEIEFTYSVRWAPSATPFSRRFERYLDYNFFEHQARLGVHNSRGRGCLHWALVRLDRVAKLGHGNTLTTALCGLLGRKRICDLCMPAASLLSSHATVVG